MITSGCAGVRLEGNEGSIGDGGVIDTLGSSVAEIFRHVAEEVVVGIANLNDTGVSDLDGWRYGRRVGSAASADGGT